MYQPDFSSRILRTETPPQVYRMPANFFDPEAKAFNAARANTRPIAQCLKYQQRGFGRSACNQYLLQSLGLQIRAQSAISGGRGQEYETKTIIIVGYFFTFYSDTENTSSSVTQTSLAPIWVLDWWQVSALQADFWLKESDKKLKASRFDMHALNSRTLHYYTYMVLR